MDLENSSILHIAANSNNLETLELYLKAYDQLIKNKPNTYTIELREKWLRTKDSEGFSCLHYAVFRGNFKMVSLL
jgi:ankyrin repeat protein